VPEAGTGRSGGTAALVPAYQAAATVGAVVAELRQQVPAVLVVDDGSTDATAERAAAAGARVLRLERNAGKGAALRAGLAQLAAEGVQRVVTLDADGQHLPSEIPVLLAAADRHPGAIVVGIRRKEGLAIRRAARFGNWFADRVLRWIAGQPLPDTQSGFRVYPTAATLALGAVGAHFDFETEILLRAARAGLPVVGVPVAVHYAPPEERVTHYRPWRDTLRIVRTVLRVMFRG